MKLKRGLSPLRSLIEIILLGVVIAGALLTIDHFFLHRFDFSRRTILITAAISGVLLLRFLFILKRGKRKNAIPQ